MAIMASRAGDAKVQKVGWVGLADLLFTRPFHVDVEYHFDSETGLARG